MQGLLQGFAQSFPSLRNKFHLALSSAVKGRVILVFLPQQSLKGSQRVSGNSRQNRLQKGVTIFLNISTQDDRSLSQLTKDRKKSVSGIVNWNNQPDREAVSLVRKGVGQ